MVIFSCSRIYWNNVWSWLGHSNLTINQPNAIRVGHLGNYLGQIYNLGVNNVDSSCYSSVEFL
jgi:hypothetical protein